VNKGCDCDGGQEVENEGSEDLRTRACMHRTRCDLMLLLSLPGHVQHEHIDS
jgi:hypothetical protein